MKKVVVLVLAGISLFCSSSLLYAVDIQFEGDFRVRGIYTDNLDDAKKKEGGLFDDQEAFSDMRFRLRTIATTGITSAIVTLDFTNANRDPNNSFCALTGCRTGNYRFGSANFGGSYNFVGVREAYLKIDIPVVRLDLGRKQFKLGHSLILDDTMDTIAATFMLGPAKIVLADAKLIESNLGGVSGSTGSDTDVYIIKTGFTHGDHHEASVFITYLNDRSAQLLFSPLFFGTGFANQSELWTIGLTADGLVGSLNTLFEVNYLAGKVDFPGATTDLDLKGLNVLAGGTMNVGAADIGLTLIFTSGQDLADLGNQLNVNGISGNYVLGNILVNDTINSDRDGQCLSIDGVRFGSGGRDCVQGAGITAIKLGVGLPDFISKNSQSEAALIWARTTESPISLSGATGDKDLGIEIDLNHRQRLDDNLDVTINLGYLISGDAWKTIGETITGAASSPLIPGGTNNQVVAILAVHYMF